MTTEHRENFESIAVYTVEIPAKEQNTPEVKELKHKEIENLVKFDVFVEVDDCGQERIGSRLVVTKKKMQESENVSEDAVATYWMTTEHRENFESIAVYTVEIPAKEQNTPEVREAKHKEIENLVKFDVFEEVDDCGQERIGSRWVVTQKEKADGQKS